MYDLVLIEPPQPYLVEPNAQENLGLLYLQSSLNRAGFNVAYCNLKNTPETEILKNVPYGHKYGVTATILDYPYAEKVSDVLRKGRDAVTILGGPMVTACRQYVDDTKFDSLFHGEAEYDIKQFLESAFPKKDYHGTLVEHLDDLPFPNHSISNTTGTFFAKGKKYDSGKAMNLITSRGCPYDCSFCGSKTLCGGKVRYRGVENVLEEIEQNLTQNGITNIRFNDDNITHNSARLKKLCRGLDRLQDKYDTPLHWRVSTRVKPSNPNQWKMMKDAGCEEISFGIESFDQGVLDSLNKRTTVYDNLKAIQDVQMAGITPRLLMMINTPGETRETVKKNLYHLDQFKDVYVSCKPFVVYPGTDIWDNPGKYDIDMFSKNYRELNFNYFHWIRGKDGEVKENPSPLNHQIGGLTLDDMLRNRSTMLSYLKARNMEA